MATAKHLFQNVEEMQQFFPFDGDFEFWELESDLNLVEEKYFREDVLGNATFNELLTHIGEDNYPAEQWEELRDRCRNVAARLTALYHLPESNIKYTSAGLLVTRSEGAVPASDARTKDLKLSIVHKVQELLDLLIRFLNRNTAVFGDWALSDHRKEYSRLIIPDALTFSGHYSIEDNHWIFRKLRSIMVEVEESYVLESIGKDYLDELRAQIESDTLSADNQLVRVQLAKMVANFTMAEAIPRLGIDISPRGIILFSNEGSDHVESFLPAEQSRAQQLIDKARAVGRSQRFRLQSFLDENASATRFAAYFNSDAYTNPEEGEFDFGNDPDDEERNGYYTG